MGFEKLTPEQRRANALKGQETRARKAAEAASGVAVMERPEAEAGDALGIPGARRPSMLAMMIAQGPKPVHVESDVSDHESIAGDVKASGGNVGGVKTTSDTYAAYWLYKDGKARIVPTGSLKVCIDNGFSIVCDVCGGEHQDETNPNACPKARKVGGWECPVCFKVIWGTSEVASGARPKNLDPLVTRPEPLGDPAKIAETKGHRHMAIYHPTAALSYGIDVDRLTAEVTRMPAGAGV